ncbi:MAG: chemotaxis protein CheW [Anaerolineales bacterium]|nr:chemotaxis protein CheW [Anaerolineales bacterium]
MAGKKKSRRRAGSAADPLANLETLDIFDETLFSEPSIPTQPAAAPPEPAEPENSDKTLPENSPAPVEPATEVEPAPKPSKTQMLNAMGIDFDTLADETDAAPAEPVDEIAPAPETAPKPSNTQILNAMGVDLDALAGESGLEEPLTPLEVNEWLGFADIDDDLAAADWMNLAEDNEAGEPAPGAEAFDRPDITAAEAEFASSLWEEIEESLTPLWLPPDHPEVTEAEAQFAQSLWEEMEEPAAEAAAFESSPWAEAEALLLEPSNTGDLAVPPSDEPLLASLKLDLDELVAETLAFDTDAPPPTPEVMPPATPANAPVPPAIPAEAAPTHLRFQQEGVHYAIPLGQLIEISQPLPITWVPNLPAWLLGICQLRGDIHSVLDLQLFVTGQHLQIRPDSRFLFVRDERAELTTALIVDAPLELTTLPTRPAKSTQPKGRRQPDHIAGFLEQENEHIILLNLDALLEKTVCRQSEP